MKESKESPEERIRRLEIAVRPAGYDAMVEASQILGMTPVEFAFWLLYPSSFLGGERPCDIFESDPERFLLAAKDLANGIDHG